MQTPPVQPIADANLGHHAYEKMTGVLRSFGAALTAASDRKQRQAARDRADVGGTRRRARSVVGRALSRS